ncbi:MAG TPA: ArsR family transcriptional regulator [Saprospiraceae bacterium]|nr:ArsR family transcriptional regulator [Saprospiraceae bacterium]
MIETLISSKTRIKLLLKFFLNSSTTSYLRGLENEFGESTNAIRIELNRLEKAGMLASFVRGNKKYFQANTGHPLYKEVHSILLKYIGFDKIIENVIERLGEVEKVYVSGAFANGQDSNIIDLILIGNINKNYLIELIEKVEKLIKRKVRYVVFSREDFEKMEWKNHDVATLLLWEKD